MPEFIKQSENYHALDDDGLNQVYKFLIYNGAQGTMLSHPFPVERLRYLQEWAVSEEYKQIRRGNYQRSASGAVNVAAETSPQEVETLRQQIEELQQEINKMKKSD